MSKPDIARLANMSTELLRTFVTVVEQEGFIKAGEYLYKTQSTISQHIQRLEQELGCSLFIPQGRKRVLNAQGEIFLSYAKRLLALQQEAQLAVAQTTIEAVVRVGVSRSLSEQIVPELLAQLARLYPSLRLLVDTGHSSDLIQGYETGLYDLVLTLERTPHAGKILGQDQMVWIGKEGYEWDKTKPLPLAAFAPPCQFRDLSTQVLDQAGIAWQMIYSTNSLTSLMASVRLGLAVTVRARNAMINQTEILTPRLALPALPPIYVVLRHRNLSEAEQIIASLITTTNPKAA